MTYYLEKIRTNIKLFGKPRIKNNDIVLTYRVSGKVQIGKITSSGDVEILKELRFKGNADTAYISDKFYLVPLGYQGLKKINK